MQDDNIGVFLLGYYIVIISNIKELTDLVLQVTVAGFPETIVSIFLRAKKYCLGLEYTTHFLNSFNQGKKLISHQDLNPKMRTKSSPPPLLVCCFSTSLRSVCNLQTIFLENIELQQDMVKSRPKRPI